MRRLFSTILILSIFLPVFSAQAQVVPAPAPAKIKILLVPGHDDTVWGAQYGTRKEADMNLSVATRIYNLLSKDKRFEVHITRDGSSLSGYTKEFADYYTNNLQDVISFEKDAKAKTQTNIDNGSYVEKVNVPHHTVSSDIALRLYGFNKWADDNKMDAVINIHFNDYPRPDSWTIGKYSGFTVYFPDLQLANNLGSSQLAANIFVQLQKNYHTSTYPPELGGLIPDQKLIVMGSNGTLNSSVRAVLIEYGYIYEKKFRTKSTRLAAYDNMAQKTVTGIQKYFFTK